MTFQKSLNLCVEFSSRKIEFRAFFLKRISGVEFYCRDEVMQNAPKISMFTFELFFEFSSKSKSNSRPQQILRYLQTYQRPKVNNLSC